MRFLNPNSELFDRHVQLANGATVVLMHANEPSLAAWAIEQVGPQGRVVALHDSHRALQTLATVNRLEISDAVYPDPEVHGPADAVLLEIPKGRDYARACLWAGARVLRPGGQLFLAGPNAGGAKPVIKDAAALFGKAPILGYRASHRLAVATRPAEPAPPAGWITEPHHFEIQRPEATYSIESTPGVFSWEHLDEGTALLLDHVTFETGANVLDVGCGYGIIGLVAAQAGAQVTMLDDNLLAVRCAAASAAANQLAAHCTILPSDITSAVTGQRFDHVISNPPFHKGLDVTTSITARIVRAAHTVLRPGGRLHLVANRFLPYAQMVEDVFGEVHILAEDNRFHVLGAVRA